MCGTCESRLSVSSSALSRGDFIKLGGLGIAGASVVGVMGSRRVVAQPEADLASEFEAAANEFDVPVELLIAMGWVNTRWEMPPPETSAYEEGNLHGMGLYGIMALVQNPSSDTLGEAAELTGLSEEELKSSRAANIRGGAALLAKSRNAASARTFSAQADSVEGGRAVDATAGVGGGEIYQEQLLEVLKSGASGETTSGERLQLAPQEVS